MRRYVTPNKNPLIKALKSKDSKDIVFKINPEKKAQLDKIVANRKSRVVRTLKEWMDKDKEEMFKKALQKQ
mgnify:CR=1 FL=1